SATECGGGRPAQFNYAVALATAMQGHQAEGLFAHLASSATEDAERAQIALARAANLTWSLGKPVTAERELDAAQQAAAAFGLANSFNALRASCRAARARSSEAVELATDALSASDVAGFARMLGIWGQVFGLADSGRVDQLSVAAANGYALARDAFDASHLRFGMALAHVDGLCLAGEAQTARAVAAQLRRDAQDFGASRQSTALMIGRGELAASSLAVAQKWLRESLALALEVQYEFPAIPELSTAWLATALAMAGDVQGAQRTLAQLPRGNAREFRYWEAEQALAEAWVAAVNGLPTMAVQTALEAANQARSLGRPAREVLCLQTATQFGDSSFADRLAELSSIVQGPRVAAAAAHCAALRAHDGDDLLEASRSYEAFGDRVAAADSAAQAAVAFREHGRRGASLTASAVAQRLAGESGADTYALRTSATELPLTGRQREIVALAARGLSNREIAEQLVLSVRTVEGHLFQASQKVGVNTREELIALLQERSTGRAGELK
ncbi:MAG: response regulator transcription factor, partial [Candidatus Acidiferrales bacterium]